MRNSLFISYSHADKEWYDQLKKHLKLAEKTKQIPEVWSDKKIPVGSKWHDEIMKALDKSKVSILLITANFFASDFIMDEELPIICAAADKSEMTIILIAVSSTNFHLIKCLKDRQFANDPRKPLMKLSEADKESVWSDIINKIINAYNT